MKVSSIFESKARDLSDLGIAMHISEKASQEKNNKKVVQVHPNGELCNFQYVSSLVTVALSFIS